MLFFLGLPMVLGAAWAIATRNPLWGVRWSALTGIVTFYLVVLAVMAHSYMSQTAIGESYTYGSLTGTTETGCGAALFGLSSLTPWLALSHFRTVAATGPWPAPVR